MPLVRRLVGLAVVLGGCSYNPTPAAGGVDGPPPICDWTFTPDLLGDVCTVAQNPMLSLSPGEWVYNTTTGELTDPANVKTTPLSKLIDGNPAIHVVGFATL